MSDENLKSKIIVQLEEQVSTRTNIIIGSNSNLFLPFVSLITGSTPLLGFLVWIPVVIGIAAIVLNIFWLYSTIKQISLRKGLIASTSIDAYKFTPDKAKIKEASNIAKGQSSVFYDAFNKAAPILMIIAWIAILALYILQLQKTITLI
jgi:hypothetical protein